MNANLFLGVSDDKHWYVVYTRPRWEKKVAELLAAADIENYCPLRRTISQWSDRKKIILEPLFKSYVFVCVPDKQKWLVKDIPGVLNYIYWLGKPAVIPKAEIELIKSFLQDHRDVHAQQTDLKPGDKIKIKRGVFLNLEGKIVALKGKKQVQIHIPSLNIALIALDTDNIEIVDIRQNNYLLKC